ncbi:MAG: bifunctional proline dehydrogenase/L-glutamate gamma-semialdehyde dehydrogenase PutA [Proteobacteria bacterium]|nr:bifunctional proline dehydrogenase/L-glutamate gamma-semialdehyde dehydrogenase PutA [Pseudomonadota bacterium]
MHNLTNPRVTPLNFSKDFLADEDLLMTLLLKKVNYNKQKRQEIKQLATKLVKNVRAKIDEMDGVDAFMKEYDLSSKEGIVLMCMAEALLRIPDKKTAEKLIKDKLLDADWKSHLGKSDSMFVNASTWGLMLTGKIIHVDMNKKGFAKLFDKIIHKTGEPAVRHGVYQAMKVMGKQFVMGRNIKEALKRATDKRHRDYRFSFDMLGEAALTQADADKYLTAYLRAIQAIAKANQKKASADAASISIKLSALHPRYEIANVERVLAELVPVLQKIVTLAASLHVAVTIDAEEADRLELSMLIFARVYKQCDASYAGFGLVIQAFQKRAIGLIDFLIALVDKYQRKIPLRLVKGAYWDTEIKRAQEQGLSDYPVFTRKVNTDISYLACADKLLAHRDKFYPQFATHNANTVAAIRIIAADNLGYEFQRLHGMGQALHQQTIASDGLNVPCRVYAPVGSHEDLLPYLVRRLLENGANTSFVNRLVDLDLDIDEITRDPIALAKAQYKKYQSYRHSKIPLPLDIFQPERKNSLGINFADLATLHNLEQQISKVSAQTFHAQPLVVNYQADSKHKEIFSPANLKYLVATCIDADITTAQLALHNAHLAFTHWNATAVTTRAKLINKVADLLQTHQIELMYLLRHEAGKSLADSIAEIKEAIDFCRYYAHQAQTKMTDELKLPGPTGESNFLQLQGKGVFVCISPWNFPLAIYAGQIVAALVTGNCVIAKPAEQTPLVGHFVAQLMHQAGVPKDVLQFVPGPGNGIGHALCQSPLTTGVVFTGSTQTAQIINKNLASRENCSIATLVAETGGQNCMLADSSTLPEQLVKDIISSAFVSAGQRCSALRVLYIQADIADKTLAMLAGAMAEMSICHPQHYSSDVGPLIDKISLNKLKNHVKFMHQHGKLIKALEVPDDLHGYYFPPHAFEIDSINILKQEVFGPFLHVIRYKAQDLDKVIAQINNTGYGLTFGIHSRINNTVKYVIAKIRAGNCYINRSTIGAVVGVHPFGGMGLSGTGPKAGGPNYLESFVTEKTITNNIAAVGGNADLLEIGEE